MRYSRCPGLPASSLPVCPVYRCFFFVPPRHPGLPVVCRYTGVVHFFMLAEPLLLLHTPTHAAAHNTTQHAGCCGQQPTFAYTPCHVRQENYANLVTALPPQNSPAAAHADVACTAFTVILISEVYAESCGISGAAYHLRKAKMDLIHARSSKPAVQADIRAMFSNS